MSRWDAPSDFDYAEECGDPIPRMRHSGNDGPRYRCVQCRRSFNALAAVRHYDDTAHVLTRGGVVQVFDFTPKCQQVSLEELEARR